MIKAERTDRNTITSEVNGKGENIVMEFYGLVDHLLDVGVYTNVSLLHHMEILMADRKKKEAEDGEFVHL